LAAAPPNVNGGWVGERVRRAGFVALARAGSVGATFPSHRAGFVAGVDALAGSVAETPRSVCISSHSCAAQRFV
jgi:hypothetical protein